jgi:hypothetical protein
MNPTVIAAISELAKAGLIGYMQYMQQAGLTAEQIDAVYQAAKTGMLARDPAKIPD